MDSVNHELLELLVVVGLVVVFVVIVQGRTGGRSWGCSDNLRGLIFPREVDIGAGGRSSVGRGRKGKMSQGR
jgi:hypothetical protein